MADDRSDITGPDIIDAERAVLGACILGGPRTITAVLDTGITPTDWYTPAHTHVWAAIIGLTADDHPVDALTVTDRLNADGTLTRAGGPLGIHDLVSATPTAANATYYARIVRRAATLRGLDLIGRRLTQEATRPGADPIDTANRALTAITNLRDTNTGGERFAMPTLREILDTPTDYDWIVPDLLERGDRLILTGAEGLGKTFWLRQIAILSAAGIHPTRFHRIDPVRVAYVDVENSYRQWARATSSVAWKAARVGVCDPREHLRVECTGRLNLLTDRDLAKVHEVVDRLTPDILVIGPLYKLVPKGLDKEEDAAALITALDGIRERGVALLCEGHAGHGRGGDGTRDLRPRGSSAQLGWPEFGIGLAPDPEMEHLATVVRWRGDRDAGRAWPSKLARGGAWPWMDAALTGADLARINDAFRQVA